MAIAEEYKRNFEELTRAFADGHVALLEVTDKITKMPAVVVVAVGFDGSTYDLVPMARMFYGNPYEELHPPDSDESITQSQSSTLRRAPNRPPVDLYN